MVQMLSLQLADPEDYESEDEMDNVQYDHAEKEIDYEDQGGMLLNAAPNSSLCERHINRTRAQRISN